MLSKFFGETPFSIIKNNMRLQVILTFSRKIPDRKNLVSAGSNVSCGAGNHLRGSSKAFFIGVMDPNSIVADGFVSSAVSKFQDSFLLALCGLVLL